MIRVGVLLLIGCSVISGCADVARPQEPAVSASSRPDGYFEGPVFVGQTVTIEGTVVRVITATSFVLDTERYGDKTLLVLCAPSRDVAAGEDVGVSGHVQYFTFSSYAQDYPIGTDPEVYAEFEGEEFLVTRTALRRAFFASPHSSDTTGTATP